MANCKPTTCGHSRLQGEGYFVILGRSAGVLILRWPGTRQYRTSCVALDILCISSYALTTSAATMALEDGGITVQIQAFEEDKNYLVFTFF